MASTNSRQSKAKRVGRYTAPTVQGRVTAAPVHHDDSSPAWYAWMLLDLLVFGVLVIILNYLQVLPGSTSSWYLVTGLVAIFSAFYLATRLR